MGPTIEHSEPNDRVLRALLRRDNPSGPYPTAKEVLDIVALLAHLDTQRRFGCKVDERIRMLHARVAPTWTAVSPLQWEHARSVCQNALRKLGMLRMLDLITPISDVSVSTDCRCTAFTSLRP